MGKIKLDGDYQTISGLDVKIYSVENNIRNLTHGAVKTTGGMWDSYIWSAEGVCTPTSMSLTEKPIFNANEIPWKSLQSSVRFVAMDTDGLRNCFDDDPVAVEGEWGNQDMYAMSYSLSALIMPDAPKDKWVKSLTERPKA